MNELLQWIAKEMSATRARRGERIQSLWGGYGELWRIQLEGADASSVVLKWVKPPALSARESDRSHRRKCRSYEVETAFYRNYAARCDATCRVPTLHASRASQNEWLLVLEDLDAAGLAGRRRAPTRVELDACLGWLAAFHARFLGVRPEGLWKIGTYWHLATRPDELAKVADPSVRDTAPEWDRALSACHFRTFVHGDAKPANFCFAPKGSDVAAVDFQYVGGGCGMKDVAYLLHGEADEHRLVDAYFTHLRAALGIEVDGEALEHEWRALYRIAQLDFARFLAGWR